VIVITARDDLAARATAMAMNPSRFSSSHSTTNNSSPRCTPRWRRQRNEGSLTGGCRGACAKRLFYWFGARRGERRYNTPSDLRFLSGLL
jgi:hypothetical protein